MNLSIYTDKSCVLRGEDTTKHKETLKTFGGKWNSNLKDGGGWIFSNKSKEAVEKWLSSLESGVVEVVKAVPVAPVKPQEDRLSRIEDKLNKILDILHKKELLIDEEEDEVLPVKRLLKKA
jgi:hypothetical protein